MPEAVPAMFRPILGDRQTMDEEHLDALVRLLSRFDGLTVDDIRASGQRLYVNVRVSEPRSLVRLEYFLRAANMRSSVFAESYPQDEDSVAASLRRLLWTLEFRIDAQEVGPSEEVQGFCAFVIWDLEKRGQIAPCKSEELLDYWNAARRVRKGPE